MNYTIKIAEAHKGQWHDFEIQREIKSIQKYLDSLDLSECEENVGCMFIKGIYDDFSKKMISALLFINASGYAIKYLKGVLRLKTCEPINIAKAIINFDEKFMGKLDNGEALLVHLNIPIMGLKENRVFKSTEIQGDFSEVEIKRYEE